MPIEVVKRNLDGMAAVKLNVFHWHLSDDQGFRVESKLFPKLQVFGSDGLYYTQEQIRDVIAYAGDRGIRVVPEFDIPGHTTSWLVGYPELASAPGPYKIERNWGVFDATMDPTRESTYQFLDAFIAEMAALFPDPFFHIGGDEVTGKQWKNSPRIRAFMRKNHLKGTEELQAYFNRRLQKVVAKHGKRMEGWDEILDPDLPKDIVIQSWRGQKSLAEAARHGFSSILSAGYYLDHMEPASTLDAVDPLDGAAASLSEEERARIIGGEIAMWGEFVSPENVASRIWPRAAAVAERLWSPQEVKDVSSMYRRLDQVITHQSSYLPMLERLAAGGSLEPLKTLADVVEPATFGQRIRTHKIHPTDPAESLGGRSSARQRHRSRVRVAGGSNGSCANANLAHPLARQRSRAGADPPKIGSVKRRHSGFRSSQPPGRCRSRGPRLFGSQRASPGRLARSTTCLSRNSEEAASRAALSHSPLNRKTAHHSEFWILNSEFSFPHLPTAT